MLIDEDKILIRGLTFGGVYYGDVVGAEEYAKIVERLEAAEKVVDKGYVLFFHKQEPEKSGVLELSKMIKEYKELSDE